MRTENGRDFLWRKIKLLFIADVSNKGGCILLSCLFACLLCLGCLLGLFTHMEGRKYNNGGRRKDGNDEQRVLLGCCSLKSSDCPIRETQTGYKHKKRLTDGCYHFLDFIPHSLIIRG